MKRHQDMSAIILAGGKSARMKKEKALLPVSGASLIEQVAHNLEPYFGEIIISARDAKPFAFLPYTTAVDETPDCGPLMGILCGLRVSRSSINFVIACDIPEIDGDFLEKMMSFAAAYDIVVPTAPGNTFEPLFAFYKKSLLPLIEELLHSGIRRINRLFPKCRTIYFPMENNGWYYNLNTMSDYRSYLEKQKIAADEIPGTHKTTIKRYTINRIGGAK
jgi:molybdopterin-guanine dinucleotide biosynthesis protein A